MARSQWIVLRAIAEDMARVVDELPDELRVEDDAEVRRARVRAFRADDRTRTRDGAGLGLSIVRAIAEAHGGRADVVRGAGATVRLWPPDAPGHARRLARQPHAGPRIPVPAPVSIPLN